MVNIHKKTLEDLEFPIVLQRVSAHCLTPLGAENVLNILPLKTKPELLQQLHFTNEYLASFENENHLPNHNFDTISKEIKLLAIENSFLEVSSFKKIAAISVTTNNIVKYLHKFQEYYPTLNNYATNIEKNTSINDNISKIIDRFGEIKDNASETLFVIRQSIQAIKGKINQSFASALTHYSGLDYLDDIRETVVQNRRVLAVKAMYRRKVKGSILGSSKTGSIVFMEPEEMHKYTRELSVLEYDESEEIIKILKSTTNLIRPYLNLLQSYQDFLTQLDLIFAKAKFAQQLHAVLPEITDTQHLELYNAYHPLLYLTNLERKEKTYPQTISLNPNHRILVISGPNAGGKSITLKTVGLLQIMIQCGMLIPVHEKSKVCLFKNILSDIGDNQSIENHLSTYSYRLKQMQYFLKKCNKNSLFLIDEFGTGSDPELGGALAETFLEEFYHREAFGIITTHYSNLKMLANEMPYMVNANMQFDEHSLEPLFKLNIGQAGSSFTFEVATKNGIPYSLINRAKKKIEGSKVRFDATIAKLQKERSKLEKTGESLKINEQKKIIEASRLEEINSKIQKKLESYQELYDSNQRLIYLGQKLDTLSDNYFNNQQKKVLLEELFKLVQVENSKRKKLNKIEKEQQILKANKVISEVNKKVKVIREQKKELKQKAKEEIPKPVLKIGDFVRLIDSKAVGTISKIEKNKALVNYGTFTTSVSIEQLEFVKNSK